MEHESGTGNRTVKLIATGESVRIADDPAAGPITLHAVGCPSSGRKGDADEAAFVARACEYDFRVAKPWGNIDPYDVLVGMGRWFWRVQVKRARHYRGRCQVRTGARGGRYTKDNIDFIAAHVVPENIWYIVPVEAFESRAALRFNSRGDRRSKYEKYCEAWCLLTCEPKARGWQDIPVLCRCKDLPVRCAACPHRT